MKVSWSEHYTMGIPEIDEDHKHLFRIAEKLVNTVESPQGMNEWSRMFVVREGGQVSQELLSGARCPGRGVHAPDRVCGLRDPQAPAR